MPNSRGPQPGTLAKKALVQEQTSDLQKKPPATLGPYGRKLWTVLRSEYPHLGASDAAVVTAFCAAHDQHERMSEVIAEEGLLTENAKGERVPNPAVGLRRFAAATMAGLCGKIGIAYASRVGTRKVDRPTRVVTAKPVNRSRKAEAPLDFATKAAELADRMVGNG